jgi:hypothetical protein
MINNIELYVVKVQFQIVKFICISILVQIKSNIKVYKHMVEKAEVSL